MSVAYAVIDDSMGLLVPPPLALDDAAGGGEGVLTRASVVAGVNPKVSGVGGGWITLKGYESLCAPPPSLSSP